MSTATGLSEIDVAAVIFAEHKLQAMSMRDLAQLSRLLSSVQGMIEASMLINSSGLTPACQMLQDFSGVIVCALSDITAVAQAHRPSFPEDANWRGWLLISHAALFCEDLSDIAATAATAASSNIAGDPNWRQNARSQRQTKEAVDV